MPHFLYPLTYFITHKEQQYNFKYKTENCCYYYYFNLIR